MPLPERAKQYAERRREALRSKIEETKTNRQAAMIIGFIPGLELKIIQLLDAYEREILEAFDQGAAAAAMEMVEVHHA